MFRQYRPIARGEHIVAAADTSAGMGDYSACQFVSTDKKDVPLVYHSKTVSSEMTNKLVPVLERIFDKTGLKPTVAYERNNGGVFEMERLASMNPPTCKTCQRAKRQKAIKQETKKEIKYPKWMEELL